MSVDSEITPIHDLERGDHVIRWTYVYIYPIQIHGIVLSAGHDIVTICDFGLTGVKSKPSEHQKDKEVDVDEHAELEDMIDIEDKAMIDACETHKRESGTYDRINIITLVEEKDINRWRKVNYGEAFTSKLSWNWWKKDSSSEDSNKCDTQVTNDESKETIIQESPKDEEAIQNDPNHDIKQNSVENLVKKELPKLQKSDPVAIVLARVRYLLSHQKDLPPHHLFFSNSECMAVWCKTGRWSTLQASVYLSSTAAGNLKTSILAATGAAKATTVVTAPATGILGWYVNIFGSLSIFHQSFLMKSLLLSLLHMLIGLVSQQRQQYPYYPLHHGLCRS